ncbi:hypothetical protein Shyd_91380 [Streptomyces hydrogenans]|uniref:Uncharacterized protein n=1 Tax=Streptomyces hydrogenans TaxID=1873719 RepID=A0ABQ3PRW8_9ACTN|nr:hypothetical protein GCM10018784_19040 [Streptomyces hydrogenans]GHI27767.1 hypothetical protein Shyd_91380 [Streptomyces hydrogenans]
MEAPPTALTDPLLLARAARGLAPGLAAGPLPGGAGKLRLLFTRGAWGGGLEFGCGRERRGALPLELQDGLP